MVFYLRVHRMVIVFPWKLGVAVAFLAAMAGIVIGTASERSSNVAPEKTVNVTPKHDIDRDFLYRGMSALTSACPNLLTYKDAIEIIEVYVPTGADLQRMPMSWSQMLSVEVKISESPRRLPAASHAQGHRLFYDIGQAGNSAGILVSKSTALAFCGWRGETPAQLPIAPPWAFVAANQPSDLRAYQALCEWRDATVQIARELDRQMGLEINQRRQEADASRRRTELKRIFSDRGLDMKRIVLLAQEENWRCF